MRGKGQDKRREVGGEEEDDVKDKEVEEREMKN